jgi:hypothetical protein
MMTANGYGLAMAGQFIFFSPERQPNLPDR